MKPRNDGPSEPVRVGSRHRGGEVSAGERNGKVWVNCFTMTGITVMVTAEEAERFARQLLALAEKARSSQPRLG